MDEDNTTQEGQAPAAAPAPVAKAKPVAAKKRSAPAKTKKKKTAKTPRSRKCMAKELGHHACQCGRVGCGPLVTY